MSVIVHVKNSSKDTSLIPHFVHPMFDIKYSFKAFYDDKHGKRINSSCHHCPRARCIGRIKHWRILWVKGTRKSRFWSISCGKGCNIIHIAIPTQVWFGVKTSSRDVVFIFGLYWKLDPKNKQRPHRPIVEASSSLWVTILL